VTGIGATWSTEGEALGANVGSPPGRLRFFRSPVLDGVNFELFDDVDLGNRRAPGDGCARPIGRSRAGRRRRRAPSHPRRASTAAMLAELRSLLRAEHGAMILRRLTELERLVRGDPGLAQVPKATRCRPLGVS